MLTAYVLGLVGLALLQRAFSVEMARFLSSTLGGDSGSLDLRLPT